MRKHCPVSCADVSLSLSKNNNIGADCEDQHPRCSVWAKLGDECDKNVDMRKYCAKSCNTCDMAVSDDSLCKDSHENCRFWADSGECKNVSARITVNNCRGILYCTACVLRRTELSNNSSR